MSLEKHIGHRVEINRYGKMAELECLTCREHIMGRQIENPVTAEPPQEPPACNMDEGCEMCGS